MSDLKKYVKDFFNELEVYEDAARGHCFKIFMSQSLYDFLDNETKDTAFRVYRTFFDSYRIKLEGSTNPFIDLLDVLKRYEENASVLIDKQRDHYIHSVNVFVLGLGIYAKNAGFRSAFEKSVMDKENYPFSYDTKHEEFFYRWGLASLFHDVGYPVEIIGSQINKFMGFASHVDGGETTVKVHFTFENFEKLNQISEVIPKQAFSKCYRDRYADSGEIDTLKPIDLLAHALHTRLGIDLNEAKAALDDFVNVMARFGFIDHGYYSAIIVLKWYGYLIQSAKYKPEYFFWPILDSAGAILLHNGYRNMMMKPPFSLGSLSPDTHPIAFLLILCDELQEWNREAYGIVSKKLTFAEDAGVVISDEGLSVTYIARKGELPPDFSAKKEELLHHVLNLSRLFKTVSIRCEGSGRLTAPKPSETIEARPALEDLEKMAKAIHELYNEKQLERNPDKPLKYPSFDTLPDSLKYSNLRQAMDIPEKLQKVGCVMRPKGESEGRVEQISEDSIEYLAEMEHESWIEERVKTGWVLGDAVNAEAKTTPYLIPYEKLPKEIKQLDRDIILNIPNVLKRIGMAIYQR